ncbi:MAG: UDP-N-acetylmuramate--L-alanine ligase [Candidatus Omnitrophica bacterium]|nr:UDP-N-acetylmuramate--L-alanine ligase [Candidatus Omnitrophota bacterium]
MKKHYHFVGIGGVGMGAIAKLLLAKGQHVSGSDIRWNKITNELKVKGAKIYRGHDYFNLEGVDCVVVSTAIHQDNPELLAARQKKIPIYHRAELLAEIMKQYTSIAVSGAHGKTTTSAMIANALCAVGCDPQVVIGGIVDNKESLARSGKGKYFVAELDESDGSFLQFYPMYSIITNIDLEHLDFYKDWDHVIKVYRMFVHQTQPGGLVIANGDDKKLRQILQKSDVTFVTYGFNPYNQVTAKNIKFDNFQSSFDCFVQGENKGRVVLNVPGQYNISNALACLTFTTSLSLDFNKVSESLANYKGVQRRFQLIGKVEDVVIVDDYAHHPTEIRATLEAVKRFQRKRAIILFQPHRYSRFHLLFNDFAESLSDCDYLIVTDIYAASENPIEGLSSFKFAEFIKQITKRKVVYLPKDKIIPHLLDIIQPGDLILSLGAGDITHIAHEFVQRLKNWYANQVRIRL